MVGQTNREGRERGNSEDRARTARLLRALSPQYGCTAEPMTCFLARKYHLPFSGETLQALSKPQAATKRQTRKAVTQDLKQAQPCSSTRPVLRNMARANVQNITYWSVALDQTGLQRWCSRGSRHYPGWCFAGHGCNRVISLLAGAYGSLAATVLRACVVRGFLRRPVLSREALGCASMRQNASSIAFMSTWLRGCGSSQRPTGLELTFYREELGGSCHCQSHVRI